VDRRPTVLDIVEDVDEAPDPFRSNGENLGAQVRMKFLTRLAKLGDGVNGHHAGSLYSHVAAAASLAVTAADSGDLSRAAAKIRLGPSLDARARPLTSFNKTCGVP
jgi:hypothetical protein